MVEYFRDGCKPVGKLLLGLEVEHFITHNNGAPVTFDEIQEVMRSMQQPQDQPIMIDGLYMGYRNKTFGVSLEPACQLEISIAPRSDVPQIRMIYESYATQLCAVLAQHGLQLHAMGCHPTCAAESLPLIPKVRYEAMDRYFRTSGGHGVCMMRATASTQVSVDYFSESDFVRKYRVASLIAPMLALLTDNAPVYQGQPNHSYCVRTHVWNDVDPERCGIIPCLMDDNFGFSAYADYILQRPLIVAKRGARTQCVGRKTASEIYGSHPGRSEIEHILSMFFFDVRLKSYIEIRVADSMTPRYISAYTQLIKTIFSSPAALDGILRHYAGATVWDITDAKISVCCRGYKARIYDYPVADEIAWLLAQAKSRIPTLEERQLLNPLIEQAARKKTLREVDQHDE